MEFGSVKITRPIVREADGKKDKLYPYMARLRKLTYSCGITVNINIKKYRITDDGRESLIETYDMEKTPLGYGNSAPA